MLLKNYRLYLLQKVELEKVKKARLERERERQERNDLEELEQRLLLFHLKRIKASSAEKVSVLF